MKPNQVKWAGITGVLSISCILDPFGIAFNNSVRALPNDDILEQISNYQLPDSQSQVTSVSQLSDVSPTDWAYEALRNLVERYGCIVGYPDRTFRGNRALSRYEFAAGLNSCLQAIERLGGPGGITEEDLIVLRRLIAEFESELAALGARVDNLEGRVAFLEDNQFSTTTKLHGEVVFGLGSILAGETDGGNRIDRVPVFGHRTRLDLTSSFTGEDELFIRLGTGNFPDYADIADTAQATLAFAQPDGNNIDLQVLNYSFPIGSTTVWLEAAGGAFDDFTDTVNILDGDGGSGALSAFGTRNLVYYQGEGAGLALEGSLGNNFGWSVGYLASDGGNPAQGAGLFNGGYGILGQIGFYPSEDFTLAFAYGHGYNTSVIGAYSGQFKDIAENINNVHNTYSLSMSWRVTPGFTLGGWGGYSKVSTLNNAFDLSGNELSRGSAELYYWAATLGFPDLFKEGNLGGIVVGQLPTLSSVNFATNDVGLTTDDNSFHIEAFYQHSISDNISITPGVVIVTNPNNNNNNSTLVIGAIRTTFSF
ncbi:cyanobacterial porin [Cyanobacterium stanieri PCC 7202]|uniref:Cyanobacterial porin n=1 Tax=Cyanobacterium stanieri (strain ATCC 29140 / PCC 7202) TaxID=292563 RepID=K9YMV3_CYASC|nr:cyanobacterial porin [Cyanobacterium stanieri PCC 7202]